MTAKPALAALVLAMISVGWASEPPSDSQVPATPPEAASPDPQAAPSVEAGPTSPQTSTPVSVSFDSAPGYRNSVFFGVPEDGAFELSIRNLELNPSRKWKPTVWVALVPDKCDVYYYLNLSVDTELKKSYARVRLIDMKQQKELLNLTHQKLYELDHEFRVRGKLEGKVIRMFVDDELVDERDVPCAPRQIEVGASSGKFVASVIEPTPPPSPD